MLPEDRVVLELALVEGRERPDRVVVSQSGYATDPDTAERRYAVRAELAWIRTDGWVLGSPVALADVAESLWAEDWDVRRIMLPLPNDVLPGRN